MKSFKILIIIVCLGLYLRLVRLSDTMMFIGDQVWFYDSARTALLTGRLPLAGITSSVTWLHQGPLYTYLLIPELALSRFYPVSGGIFTAFIGAFTIILTYFLIRLWTGRVVAALSGAFVLAVSPLAVIHARMPYHTSVIPFFLAVFLLFLYRKKYFFAFLFLGFLYQLELSTVVFWPIFIFTLYRQKYHFRLFDLISFSFGILPFLVSGPVQVFGVFIWSVYHLLFHHISSVPATAFYLELLNRYLFPILPVYSLLLFVLCLLLSLRYFRSFMWWLYLPLAAMFINRTPSEAYFTMLFVPLAVVLGLGISRLPRIFTGLLLINVFFLFSTNFLSDISHYGPPLSSRINLSRQILQMSVTKSPQIITIGPGDTFPTYQLPYQYLISWLAQTSPPAGSHSAFTVQEITQTFRVVK